MPKPNIPPELLRGVWSATPTPFTERMRIDRVAVRRMVKHHLRLGVKGLFLCGTCGEGPWMTDEQRLTLVKAVAECAKGKMALAVQVSDNSAARILRNSKAVAEAGADIAVIAPPSFLLNATSANLAALYLEAVRRNPLPVGIYDRGSAGSVVVPLEVLKEVYAEKKVVLVKDSSMDTAHKAAALEVRASRGDLRLLNGYEFDCVSYLESGYDGLLLGGGVFNGHLAGLILQAVRDGKSGQAQKLQRRMNRLMRDAYGGRELKCWLTGLKELLVQMGIFRTNRSYLNFPLTASCRTAIRKAMARDAALLWP